jgi:hypothetical protein
VPYNFNQTRIRTYPNQTDTISLINYKIKNGKFEGEWNLSDKSGQVIEIGNYHNGNRVGVWKIVSQIGDYADYGRVSTKIELLEYENGRPLKSIITIVDKEIIYASIGYETVSTRSFEKDY